MRTERHSRGFEAEPRTRAGLEEQQRDRAAEQLLPRRQTGLEVVRRVAEIIDIVDGEVSRAQQVPKPA
jgi:hypothetical protein